MTKEEKQKVIDALKISAPIKAMAPNEFNDYIKALNKITDWLEQATDLKEAYNKGYKDGQDALAYHIELCKEEGSIVTVPEGATRRDLHKLVFGIDVPELHSDKFRCAREKGCSNCKHKDNINCDMVWWDSPYRKEN